jgi:hypothetical protein
MTDSETLSKLIGTSVFDLTTTIPGLSSNEKQSIGVTDALFEIDNKNITNRPDLFGIY